MTYTFLTLKYDDSSSVFAVCTLVGVSMVVVILLLFVVTTVAVVGALSKRRHHEGTWYTIVFSLH